jgi:hypothetical protein
MNSTALSPNGVAVSGNGVAGHDDPTSAHLCSAVLKNGQASSNALPVAEPVCEPFISSTFEPVLSAPSLLVQMPEFVGVIVRPLPPSAPTAAEQPQPEGPSNFIMPIESE